MRCTVQLDCKACVLRRAATERQLALDRKKRQAIEAAKQYELDVERSKLSQWQQELDGDESDEEALGEATVRRLDLSWGCFAQARVIHFCMGSAGQQCSYSRLRACTKHVQSLVHPAVFWRSA